MEVLLMYFYTKEAFFRIFQLVKLSKLANHKKPVLPSIGIGYSQSKILIETRNQNIPFLSDEYKKGYDKKRGGFSTKLVIDFRYFNRKNNWQFIVGSELIQSLTKTIEDTFTVIRVFLKIILKTIFYLV